MREIPHCMQLGNIVTGKSWDNPQSGRIYSVDGIAPCLTCGGGNLEPKILEIKQKGTSEEMEKDGG